MLGSRGALCNRNVGSRDVGSRDVGSVDVLRSRKVGSRQVLHDCSHKRVMHLAQVAQFRGL